MAGNMWTGALFRRGLATRLLRCSDPSALGGFLISGAFRWFCTFADDRCRCSLERKRVKHYAPHRRLRGRARLLRYESNTGRQGAGQNEGRIWNSAFGPGLHHLRQPRVRALASTPARPFHGDGFAPRMPAVARYKPDIVAAAVADDGGFEGFVMFVKRAQWRLSPHPGEK